MQLTKPTLALPVPPAAIFNLSTKLTIGGAVCISEGLVASVMAVLPKNHWFYIGWILMTVLIWASFWRFRTNKMGAEIGDLWFLELACQIVELLVYVSGVLSPTLAVIFWWSFTSMSAMKLIRVYLWQSSATQQYGWGIFGLMTWHYAKHHAPATRPAPRKQLLQELALALLAALVFSWLVRQIPDIGRVIVMWVLPLSFEFANGPLQLRSLAALQQRLMASIDRETEKDTKIAQLEKQLDLQRQPGQLPGDVLDVFTAAYNGVQEDKRAHMLEVVQVLAKNYPAKSGNEK